MTDKNLCELCELCEQSGENLIILPFSGDAQKITRLLSGKTSIRVLEALGENCLSAGELSSKLDLRLNTLHYHLDSLLEAGLIRVAEVGWSQKGRKIKFYMAAKIIIILGFGKARASQTIISGLLRQYLCEGAGQKVPEPCPSGI